MSDPIDVSKDDIRKEIMKIFENPDLSNLTANKIRKQIEENLGIKLTEKQKEIDDLVIEFLVEAENTEDKKSEVKKVANGSKQNFVDAILINEELEALDFDDKVSKAIEEMFITDQHTRNLLQSGNVSVSECKFQFNLDIATNPEQTRLPNYVKYDLLYLILMGDVKPKAAITAVNKKILSHHLVTAEWGTEILSFIMKFGNKAISNEVWSDTNIIEIVRIVIKNVHKSVQKKLLRLILIWKFVNINRPKYKQLLYACGTLTGSGFNFPSMSVEDLARASMPLPNCQCHRCLKQFKQLRIIPLADISHPLCSYCFEILDKLAPFPKSLPKPVPSLMELVISTPKPSFPKTLQPTPKLQLEQKVLEPENSKGAKPKRRFVNRKLCKVCDDSISTYAFVSCGHRCICANCVKDYKENTCPSCKCNYSQVIEILDN